MTQPNLIFDSYTKPIPPFRRDVQQIPVEQDGESYIYFFDSMGYATPNFAVPESARSIFQLFDGRNSVEQVLNYSSEDITKERVLEYVQFLDEQGLLQSPYLQEQMERVEQEYEASDIHQSSTAGMSYPDEAGELSAFFEEAFSKLKNTKPADKARALYAPHIDLRVGMNSYVRAFSALKKLSPKRVVVLATSHYSGMHPEIYEQRPFVLSRKAMQLVNGEVPADQKALDDIKDYVLNHPAVKELEQEQCLEQFGITFQDRAHRVEHSIELHALMLNHIWDHDFSMVPILVGGLDEMFYKADGFRGQQVYRFSDMISELFGKDEDTFFLISGDLAHIGRKFGDPRPAQSMFEEIRTFDRTFMDEGAGGNAKGLLEHMSQEYDPYRICGFPPLFTFLNVFDDLKGEILSYDIWDESERDSAVSFGSLLYR